jgi:hypothetical protein
VVRVVWEPAGSARAAMVPPEPGGLAGAFFWLGLAPPRRQAAAATVSGVSAASGEPLLVVTAHHPARPRMNEVHLPERLATHGLIGAPGRVTGPPSQPSITCCLNDMVCLILNISQSLTYMLESDLYVSIKRTLKVTIHHKQFYTTP